MTMKHAQVDNRLTMPMPIFDGLFVRDWIRLLLEGMEVDIGEESGLVFYLKHIRIER